VCEQLASAVEAEQWMHATMRFDSPIDAPLVMVGVELIER